MSGVPDNYRAANSAQRWSDPPAPGGEGRGEGEAPPNRIVRLKLAAADLEETPWNQLGGDITLRRPWSAQRADATLRETIFENPAIPCAELGPRRAAFPRR